MYQKDFAVLKKRIHNFPSIKVLSEEATYGSMEVSAPQDYTEQMYGIKLHYDPRKEPFGKNFPSSTILVDHIWRVEGTIVIPKELEDLVGEVIIR